MFWPGKNHVSRYFSLEPWQASDQQTWNVCDQKHPMTILFLPCSTVTPCSHSGYCVTRLGCHTSRNSVDPGVTQQSPEKWKLWNGPVSGRSEGEISRSSLPSNLNLFSWQQLAGSEGQSTFWWPGLGKLGELAHTPKTCLSQIECSNTDTKDFDTRIGQQISLSHQGQNVKYWHLQGHGHGQLDFSWSKTIALLRNSQHWKLNRPSWSLETPFTY